MPWTMAAFALAALSIIGIPMTSGFVSKWYLAQGTVERHSFGLLVVILASSLLSAAYLGPIVYKAYFEREPAHATDHAVREVPWMVAPLVLCALASLILGLYPAPVLELASKVMP
jgi:multicomponent Na+:H+ antiporter subunit D